MINIIEECRSSPPPSTVAELSLPLTFFDVAWLNFHEIQRLLFYKFPHTKSSFIEAIIPKLKTSLSLALNHYLPLAGNLVYPLEDSDIPFLRYVAGDSIPLTFAESSEDFDSLVGNQPRKCDDFYPLIPELPPPYVTTSSKIIPLFAVQVTVFPNSGIAIGSTNQHVIGDANSIVRFIKAWASINKLDGDSNLLATNLLPFYDRSVIKDPYNLRTRIFNHTNETNPWQSSRIPANKFRATFVLTQSEIQKLKNYVLGKRPALTHVSSFTVTCAYIWTCWLKTKDAVGETAASDKEAEFLLFSVDCRSRLDPPLPETYFGNCLIACYATLTHKELVSKNGFLVGSELIGASIHKMVNDKEGILNGSGLFNLDAINWKRVIGVTGTPKYDTYDADFGWGRPEKFESISIDIDGAMSLNKSSGKESGLEVGLSMPENKMEAFRHIFSSELGNLFRLLSIT